MFCRLNWSLEPKFSLIQSKWREHGLCTFCFVFKKWRGIYCEKLIKMGAHFFKDLRDPAKNLRLISTLLYPSFFCTFPFFFWYFSLLFCTFLQKFCLIFLYKNLFSYCLINRWENEF